MTISPTPDAVRVRAPGKVNLVLAVGELEEDGYHQLATAFQALSLTEEITATSADGISVSVSGTIDHAGVPLDESNLAFKAAQLLQERTGVTTGVHLSIHKGVPVAGGMGGGSADAAAALVACDALWGTNLSQAELHALAAELGADVPFSLQGGTAMGTGRGDELSPMLSQGRFDWVLVTNAEGLSTPRVYGELDAIRARLRADLPVVPVQPQLSTSLFHALRAGDAVRLADALHNDLQQAAIALRPELADVIELGLREGALAGIVSGSGPTIALLCASPESAIDVQVAMIAAGYDSFHAHGPVAGTRIVSTV
ncbi:4-(cytidine 5'-diphospho)-2-C-methyl-D-erythritol kinase [Microbacterium sp. NC79]|uniref:4-(cytidine 5'-diphospho)-2-C-methyl-D-erythritol kinase n=1 Tax=Microbacterium sp. NC79 TaxID=2851009 RepID=UPI001C2BCCFE|nr:4-(cytidine 5'-diphospho)-2-C-methyl-D-erythritol kinase [Microbacterium sp. NC79]